ncbi:charged multivesicular body protein 7-like isoform X1 [Littorina saxatilis]|uniref:Charged multivesicular body protein 7 n=1 Tax=Littorina saxatilis TaxID=31220 RepID=A0AAN9BNP0_9CAEN
MLSPKLIKSSEWMDDQKASVLFAPFREKSLNPNSWEKKMNFWTSALLECAQSHGDLVMDLKTYRNYFERQGKHPKCLETVLKEMLRTGKLQRMADFERQSSSWMRWGVDTFLRRPVVWGLTQLLATGTSAEDEVFLIPDQVKRKSAEVLAHHHSKVQHEATDNVMEVSAFRAQCLGMLKSEAECDIVLKQLELDRKLLVTRSKDGSMIVKICGQSEARVQPVQELELNIFRIRKVMKCLEQQIETLSEQCDSYTAEAKKLVREQRKTVALHQLRKRRTLQRQIDKKSSCIDTLHDIIHRIEDATSNEMVVKAYESGVSAIRQLTGDVNIDKVDQVLDDLQEVLQEQEDVSEAIAGVSLPGSEVNTDALEKELYDLLAEGPGKGDSVVMEPASVGGGHRSFAERSNSDMDALISGLSGQSLIDLPEVPASPPGMRSSSRSPQKNLEYAS